MSDEDEILASINAGKCYKVTQDYRTGEFVVVDIYTTREIARYLDVDLAYAHYRQLMGKSPLIVNESFRITILGNAAPENPNTPPWAARRSRKNPWRWWCHKCDKKFRSAKARAIHECSRAGRILG